MSQSLECLSQYGKEKWDKLNLKVFININVYNAIMESEECSDTLCTSLISGLEFEMILIILFVPVILSAAVGSISTLVCPESFGCIGMAPFKYPFYNVKDTGCGLINVNCTSKGGEIQIGGRSYGIIGKYDTNQNSSVLLVWNGTFGQLLNNAKCKALTHNFTFPSPSPHLYSISITAFITLFKCTVNVNFTYFEQHNYNSYDRCEDHTYYYNYFNSSVPSDLPQTCQVVQLPVKLSTEPGLNETNIFSLLNPVTSIEFILTPFCVECQKKGRLCTTENGHDHCLDVKWERPHKKQSRDRTIKILVITASTIILILSFVIFIICRHHKNNHFSYVTSKKKSPNLEDVSFSCGVSVFSYKELEDATCNFDHSHELGDGGFGAVYYGKVKDGREVAVKKLHEHNYNRVQHFRNEVEILTKLKHQNLVVLYGCTSRQNRELLLVYEYIPNGTVADHLHGELANPSLLTWPIRMNIAIETASALVYLHASEIIHRDVKTSNILLDHNFCVKVADLGLSRLISNNVTHVSTAPQGTPGYVDPQYHQRYQLTEKSDVYSFGVVLIELISSMVPVDLNRSQDEVSLANLALNRIQRREIDKLVDPVLVSDGNPEIMNMITLVAELGFRCLQYDSDFRPTMKEVLNVLMDIQAVGRIDAHVPPLSKISDSVVLLKEFHRSPVSVTSEWQSNNSASTTVSSNGDRLSMKTAIIT
ncbi:LEAF RUST 10 DISEASE-RESISTANCE LOCUS RECEPTOR-LIKE PROTEIN KINASE-like 1.1 [Bidens hawaiensis]|uniref:LEAF RUST 10 DISEASE-RESISTANCE LOCUS RECEPTOR-LIKE PROTEIN KINASE-like 1.1 n=1 Tax=Bidens hawaiensis TaxID=980011 RepID=UPI00404B06EC